MSCFFLDRGLLLFLKHMISPSASNSPSSVLARTSLVWCMADGSDFLKKPFGVISSVSLPREAM